MYIYAWCHKGSTTGPRQVTSSHGNDHQFEWLCNQMQYYGGYQTVMLLVHFPAMTWRNKFLKAVFPVVSHCHLCSWCADVFLYPVPKQVIDVREPMKQTLTAFQRCIKWRATSRAAVPTTTAPTSCHGIRGVVLRSTRSAKNQTKKLVKVWCEILVARTAKMSPW
jgi:hypothetical protein